MLVFLNGKLVPETKAVVSVFDRGFLLGDGLFETLRVFNGKPFLWEQHWKRLQRGAAFLKIKLPFAEKQIRQCAGTLIAKNKMPDGLLRLVLSRGAGKRGYSPKGATRPTLVMSLHPMSSNSRFSVSADRLKPELQRAPVKWKLITSSFRLPANEPLARFKTCNKLPQVLARAEADDAGADEALLLNTDGFVVEGASSNLFWIERGTVFTPPLQAGILAGVTREVVRDICARLKIPLREKNIRRNQLALADGIFLSLSSFGIVEAERLDGKKLRRSSFVSRISNCYNEMLTTL